MSNITSPSALRQAGITLTISASNVFSGLNASIIDAVAAMSHTRALKKNELLCAEGDLLDEFYIVQTGQIALTTPEAGKTAQIIQVFGPKTSTGMVSMITRNRVGVRFVALKPSHVIVIPREPFLKLYHQTPELALRLYTALAEYTKTVFEGFGTIKGRTLESRLALWIVHESSGQDMTEPDLNSYAIPLKINKKNLSAKLGVTSETLSRMLAYFRDEGVFKITKHEIEVMDRKALQDYAFGRRGYTSSFNQALE